MSFMKYWNFKLAGRKPDCRQQIFKSYFVIQFSYSLHVCSKRMEPPIIFMCLKWTDEWSNNHHFILFQSCFLFIGKVINQPEATTLKWTFHLKSIFWKGMTPSTTIFTEICYIKKSELFFYEHLYNHVVILPSADHISVIVMFERETSIASCFLHSS